MKIDKPRLRSALRKLRRIPYDRRDPYHLTVAPQEMLDFLAMLAGLKPVCLIGRGFDDSSWIDGIKRLSAGMNLHVITGPEWHARPETDGLPDWYGTIAPPELSDVPVLYVCKSRSIADEVKSVCVAGSITIEQESRLLGYPKCCVTRHYDGTRVMNEAFSLMLNRAAKDNRNEMERLVREDEALQPETDEERRLVIKATTFHWAPFTSINMCSACASSGASPAQQLSRRYEELAEIVDHQFAAEIRQN